MARRTILLSEVNLTEESVNLDISGNLAVTGTSTFTGQATFNGDIALASGNKFYLDGGGNTYITETTGDIIDFFAGGTRSAQVGASVLSINVSNALDWGGDTKLFRDAANVIAMKNAANVQTFRVYGDATAATLKYMNLTHDGTNAIITTSGGTFGFGTQTTSAATNINGITGYVSIVDSGGTPLRLAVVT